MNKYRGKENFRNFVIILDIVCSYKILMRRLITKLKTIKYAAIQWNTQLADFTTDLKVKYILPYLNLAQWKL